MHIQQTPSMKTRRRNGQTLVEFALTLPLFLLLIFGTIEFGRLFQAWVTIQNSAREAARYATTGQWDDEKYDIETVVPCLLNEVIGVYRGTLTDYLPNPEEPSYVVEVYEGGEESLYATWYDGEDCDPTNEDHQARREDILRTLSIMDEARRGAAGLSLEPNRIEGTEASAQQVLREIWTRPMPRSNEPGWFNVMVCSDRNLYNREEEDVTGRVVPELESRFIYVRDEAPDTPGLADALSRYDPAFCLLNELPTTEALSVGATTNAGVRWLDPGDGADTVNVVVTFNHPLITPLGLADYITIQARRSGVVEAFQDTEALQAPVGGPSGPGGIPTPAAGEPTFTYTPSPTRTRPPTLTYTPTTTLTPTAGPFACENLTVQNVGFSGGEFFLYFENNNYQATSLTGVVLTWRRPAPGTTDYDDMALRSIDMSGDTQWQGQLASGPLDTRTFLPGTDEYERFVTSDRRVAGYNIARWGGLFINVGENLGALLDQWDFGGSIFFFDDPTTPNEDTSCQIPLSLPPEPDPTDPPPVVGTSTPPYTPDCASTNVSVRWIGFEEFGVVALEVINQRQYDAAVLSDFSIVWPDPRSLTPSRSLGLYNLDRITVGGANPDDSRSVTVWRGPDSNQTPPTTRGEGTWLQNYTFPPNSTTRLYLDFEGTASRLDTAFGIRADQFNGTRFTIGCSTRGGGGTGPGQQPPGNIFLATNVPPPPTNTRAPSNTPGPTLTPSPTRPTNTPSRTPTPGPTFTPSRTLTPTNTQAPTRFGPPPTQPPSCGGDAGSGTGC